MEPIKKLIPEALARHNITRQVKAATICDTWNSVAPKIIQMDIVEKTEVVSFSHGTLKILVPSPSFIQEIKIKEIEIIDKLNKKIGKTVVERIKAVI